MTRGIVIGCTMRDCWCQEYTTSFYGKQLIGKEIYLLYTKKTAIISKQRVYFDINNPKRALFRRHIKQLPSKIKLK